MATFITQAYQAWRVTLHTEIILLQCFWVAPCLPLLNLRQTLNQTRALIQFGRQIFKLEIDILYCSMVIECHLWTMSISALKIVVNV